MTELHFLYLSAVDAAEERRWLDALSIEERARVAGTAHPLRRRQRLAGLHLARCAAAEFLGIPPEQTALRRRPSGQLTAEGCCLSLSHSGDLVVCAVGELPLGVDAERIRPAPLALAQRCFTDAERALLAAAAPEERDRCFWRIWTGKEALVKRSGQGLTALRRADTCALPPPVRLSWQEREGYLIALAAEEE